MNTTYYKDKDMVMVDGEVNIFFRDKNGYIASTANINNVPKLERKWFVNPKVDVNQLAHIHANDTYIWPLNKQGNRVTLPPNQTTPPNYKKHCKTVETHFRSGFNSNPAVYTEEEMRLAFSQGRNQRMSYEAFINTLCPVEIPNSITLDEKFNLISIEW